MWIRGELKERAKRALRTNGYWIALGATALTGILIGGFAGGASNASRSEYPLDGTGQYSFEQLMDAMGPLMPVIVAIFIAMVLAGIAYGLFVVYPVLVGKNRFFLEHRARPSSIGVLFSAFKPGYLNVIKTMFLTQLFIFLWSLLLFIPGIIKTYQYILVPYLLAENPKLEWRRALELSRGMTDGCKFRIFVLQLSFIGWLLLGLVALGIGLMFVSPYVEATTAELYADLRAKALERGLATAEELPGVN